MPDEKRQSTRVQFRVQAKITVNDIKYTSDQISNLSIGGCLLPIQAEWEPGTPCRLDILMSGTSSELSVQIDGNIHRCDKGAVAVRFTGIDPDSLFHLQNIVLYNSSDSMSVEQEIQRHPGLG